MKNNIIFPNRVNENPLPKVSQSFSDCFRGLISGKMKKFVSWGAWQKMFSSTFSILLTLLVTHKPLSQDKTEPLKLPEQMIIIQSTV
jgi:hypothetical protein